MAQSARLEIEEANKHPQGSGLEISILQHNKVGEEEVVYGFNGDGNSECLTLSRGLERPKMVRLV